MIPIKPLTRRLPTALLAVLFCGPAWTADADDDLVGRMSSHVTVFEDNLLNVARANDLGFVELRAANPDIDPWLPGADARIILPTAHLLPDAPREGLVINLAEMRLYYFLEPGGVPVTYPIGIGREGWTTPTGSSRIVRKAEEPSWYPPESIRAERPELPAVIGPGEDNPLGDHALYLDWPAYLIHGTNRPWGIGRRVSSGCIRMYPEDIAALFETVPVNTLVTVVDQPVKLGWIDGALYVEAHPTQSQADMLEIEGRFDAVVPDGILGTVEAYAAQTDATQSDGRPVDWAAVLAAVKERRGYPVRVSR